MSRGRPISLFSYLIALALMKIIMILFWPVTAQECFISIQSLLCDRLGIAEHKHEVSNIRPD